MKYRIFFRIISVFAAVAVPAMMLGCIADAQPTEPNYTISLISPEQDSVVDLCDPKIREYLQLEDERDICLFLMRNSNCEYDYMSTMFRWQGDGSSEYTVSFADNEDFENAVSYQVTGCVLENRGVFIPGRTYWWKVTGNVEGSVSPTGTFRTLDDPVRYITTDEFWNVRDLGGWKTTDGKTVKYGMLYRGGKTNTAGGNKGPSEEDIRVFTELLGIHTEMDLRFIGIDDDGQTRSVFGDGVKYLKTPIQPYTYIIPSFKVTEPVLREYDPNNAVYLEAIFRFLANEDNYPLYFHCTAGADRTGTLAFLINGLLGVSRENLTRDYELTSFSEAQGRWRSSISRNLSFDEDGTMYDTDVAYVGWNAFIDRLLAEYGTQSGTLADAIENYLITACNVKPEHIESLKNIMLVY